MNKIDKTLSEAVGEAERALFAAYTRGQLPGLTAPPAINFRALLIGLRAAGICAFNDDEAAGRG